MSDQFTNGWGSTQAPFSQEAEEAVLGAILLSPDVYLDVAAFLEADDFYILRHRYIYEAFGRISARNDVIDYLTVNQELKDCNQMQEIGGPAFITHLLNSTPTSVHAVVYARLIESAATRRRLMVASDHIKGLAMNTEMTIEDVVIQSQLKLDDAIPDERERTLVGGESIEHYDAHLAELQMQKASGQMVSYPLPPEWTRLGELIPAIYPGDFIVVSGLPGSGKSCFLEQWAEHCARIGLWTKYTHTEMSTEQILHRRMARHSGLPYSFLTSGDVGSSAMTLLQRRQMQKADYAIREFASHIIYDWMPDPQFARLAVKMRRDAIAGVKVFFIDHFQDVQAQPAKGDNIVLAYEAACRWLAAFAEFRRVTVIVASQENKGGGTKWSGKLLEKALTRISIKRDNLHTERIYRVGGTEFRAMPGEADPLADIVVGKARFGKRGKVRMFQHGPAFRWLNSADGTTKPQVARAAIEIAREAGIPEILQ